VIQQEISVAGTMTYARVWHEGEAHRFSVLM